jgi:hypothetical protein
MFVTYLDLAFRINFCVGVGMHYRQMLAEYQFEGTSSKPVTCRAANDVTMVNLSGVALCSKWRAIGELTTEVRGQGEPEFLPRQGCTQQYCN